MAGVEVKTFDKADEVNNNFENAKIEAVKVGNQRVMKLTLQPGCINSILIKTENAVPITPAMIAKIKYIVPISLWLVE